MTHRWFSLGTRLSSGAFILSALLLFCFGGFAFSDVLTPEKLQKSLDYCFAVTSSSHSTWEGAALTNPATYYDAESVPLAYVYSITKGSRYLGFLTVSARDDCFPYFMHSESQRPDARFDEALDVAREIGVEPGDVERIFSPPFDYLVRIKPKSAENKAAAEGLVVHLGNMQVVPRESLVRRIDTYYSAVAKEADEINGFWRHKVLAGPPPEVKQGGDVYVAKIYNSDAHDYEYVWYKGCGPTTITMMLSYYGGSWGYRRFWGEGPESFAWCPNTSNPYTIRELNDKVVEFGQSQGDLGGAGYEGCDLMQYGITRPAARYAIEATGDFYRYPFSTDALTSAAGVTQDIITTLQIEINKNHPVYFGIQQDGSGNGWNTHAVLGVGYSYHGAVHEVIAHNTWGRGKFHAAMESFGNWEIIIASPLGFQNTPPVLSEPAVEPHSGPPDSNFNFHIHYYDEDEATFYRETALPPYFEPNFEPFNTIRDDNGGNWADQRYGGTQLDYKGDPIAGNGICDAEPWNDMGDRCSSDTWYADPDSTPWPDVSDWWSSDYAPYNPKDYDTYIDVNNNGHWEAERFDDMNCNGMWDGDSGPSEAWVVLDGVAYPMTMIGTFPDVKRSDCYYESTLRLTAGVHQYYFYFNDGNGGTARQPARGGIYYDLRVGDQYNSAPELPSSQLLPSTGSRITLFTYSAHYYDADGDAPSTPFIFIDDVPHSMTLVSGVASDGLYEYQTFLTEEAHDYYFEFTDGYGKAARVPLAGHINGPVVLGGDQVPMLSDGIVTPANQLVNSPVSFTARYTSPHNYEPISKDLVIDGSPYDMLFLDAFYDEFGNINYASGATYYFTTADLSIGTHHYYFNFVDETGGTGRLPLKGEISGPNISDTNIPPVLTNGIVDPASGTTSTDFVFAVSYADMNANPPQDVWLYVDDEVHTMGLVDGAAFNGVYSAVVSGLSEGLHSYWFYAADNLGAQTRLPRTPGDQFEGPFIRKTNVPPTLAGGLVTPNSGGFLDMYAFSVDYYDEQGDAPQLISVWVDDQEHKMSLASGVDFEGTYTYFASPGTLATGDHHYYFFANDGFGGTARYPTTGYFIGPVIEHALEAMIPYWLVNKNLGIDTTLIVTNPGEEPALVTLTLTRFNAEEIPKYPFAIEPGATVVFRLSQVDGVHQNQNDYGTGFATWPTGKLVVYCKIDAGGSIPVTLSGARPGPLHLPFWQVATEAGVGAEVRRIFDTTIVLANPHDNDVDVTIDLFDEFGARSAEIHPVLDRKATKVLDLSESIFEGPNFGSAEITVSDPIRVWAAMINYKTGGGIEIPVIERSEPSPYLVSSWKNMAIPSIDSFIVFNNYGETPASPQTMFYNEAGQMRGADLKSIPPGGLGFVQASRCTRRKGMVDGGFAEASWGLGDDIGVFAVWLNNISMTFYSVPPARMHEPPIYLPYWERDELQNKETMIFVRNTNDTPLFATMYVNDRHGYPIGEIDIDGLIPNSMAEHFVGEVDVHGEGSITIVSKEAAPKPIVVWGMLLNTATGKGCLVPATEAWGTRLD